MLLRIYLHCVVAVGAMIEIFCGGKVLLFSERLGMALAGGAIAFLGTLMFLDHWKKDR